MRKILCLNAISKKGTDYFPSSYELLDNCEDPDAILVRSASMHEMEIPKTLRCVARAGAGVNNIPLDKLAEQGIVVFNTPGANANAVRELVVAGMMMAARDIVGGIEWCKEQKEDPTISKDMEKAKKQFSGTEVRGKKLGIIGLGAVGAEVANAAIGIGMEVYGYDPFISVHSAWMLSRSVKHSNTPEEIYRTCDYISIHVPLMDSTRGMINKNTLSMMKDGVVILNYARDLLVNDDDMEEALESGKVYRYMTDFPNPKVMHMPNTVVTPHLGASTQEAEENCAVMAVHETIDYLENGNIRNSVNYPAIDMGICTSARRIAVLHKNVPNMLSQISSTFADDGVNIANLMNKSRGQHAYTLVDLESDVEESTLQKIHLIRGVYRVRIIK